MGGSIMSPMNHTVVGTTRYMSPERLRGKPYAKSSDVWSLGLVLLEIARGDSPFEDITSVVSLILYSCLYCSSLFCCCCCGLEMSHFIICVICDAFFTRCQFVFLYWTFFFVLDRARANIG
mmetsp:Transcript_17354/g.31372  ORF Transcript_17354/g.31372 Transcript_17354/m.31372 type:complete len:121 (+) Transcript_17354:426-788(+)